MMPEYQTSKLIEIVLPKENQSGLKVYFSLSMISGAM
jgi:hypothetical protein